MVFRIDEIGGGNVRLGHVVGQETRVVRGLNAVMSCRVCMLMLNSQIVFVCIHTIDGPRRMPMKTKGGRRRMD